MAYGKKYILSFISDRGNDYKVEVLQQGFSGAAVVKSFGSAPILNIEDGDGRVKGSSLAFSIQADTEGELSGLYTTNNKEYKVILYRNNDIYWQGYLLPELYSENYVDPPYDVAVTATDQLATLKDVPYQGEDTLKSLLDIVKGILLNTKVDIPCKIHMQLSNAQGSLLSTSYISAAAYNGQSCYDVLNAILLSCNCSIMQMGNEWIISSYTDATTTYATDLGAVNVPHCTIGQMDSADVCPDGSLTMVNAPALKGATVEYNHIVRNSMLLNPDCKNRDNWMYTPGTIGDRFPGEIEGEDVIYKAYAWQLNQKNLKTDNALQVWQDIALEQDTTNAYSLSVKTLFTGLADLLLLSVSFSSEYGTTWYLTADGWKTGVDRTNVNGYIQVTGQSKGDVLMLQGVSDMSNYDTTTVQFMLPEVAGTLRVGFINSTSDYSDPLPYRVNQVYVTGVYLTIANVTGKTSTTVVEKNATSAQEEVAISYGEAISSPNADKMDLSYLRYADGQRIESVELSGEEFSSYYLAMVQDFSRYYGVKKMQLQGALMGADVLHPIYKDVFSSKVLRLVSGQYNLLDDSVSISLEEVPTAFVDYTLTVYAKENAVQNTTTSASGSVAVSGGDTYFGLQADGDIFVKGDRSLTGKEGRFDNLALPSAAPAGVSADKTYIYSSDPAKLAVVDMVELVKDLEEKALKTDLTAVDDRVKTLEALGLTLEVKDGVTYVKSKYSFYTMGGLASGEPSSSGGGGGTVGGSNVSFKAELLSGTKIGTITIDNVATNIYAPSTLPNPYALTINGITYDGSESKTITISGSGGGVSGDYLPLGGGTITSAYETPLYINTSSTQSRITFQVNGTNKSLVGYNPSYGAWMYNFVCNKFIGLKDDGTPFYYDTAERTLIHSGNIGSYAPVYNYNGNVLIGTTTDNGKKLQVEGTITSSNWYYSYNDTGWYSVKYAGGIYMKDDVYVTVYNSKCLQIQSNVANRDAALRTERTDTGYSCFFGLGSGGVNRGIWDNNYNKWLINASNDGYTYLANDIMIKQDKWDNGLILNRTVANSGASIVVMANGVRLGNFGLNGSKKYEFNVQNSSGTSTVVMSCDANGNFEAIGGVASRQPSDRRLKENICTISTTDAVSVLRKLNPITFKWNALATSLDSRNTGDSVGFIADEYEGLIVNSGRYIWEKYRAIDYTKAIPYLAKGWQVHDVILVKHADNIEDLRTRVERLEAENRELKQRLNMRA